MHYTRLGSTGLIVSRLSFGTVTFSSGNTMGGIASTQGTDADAIVGQAIDAGVNFFDTADVYGATESEVVLGRALKPHRDSIVLTTKVGGRVGTPLIQAGLGRRHILWEIDRSLARLGTDWVDLYVCHFEDPHTPLEETLEALDAVVRSGKARYIGFSNWSAWKVAAALEMQKANGWARFTHGQMYYSLLCRDIERDMVPLMQAYGLGLTVWSPLTSGFLSGKYRPETLNAPGNRFAIGDFLPFDKRAGFALVEQMREIANALRASVAQVALAWLLAKPAVTSLVLGATRPDQLADNLGAVDVALDAETMARLDAATALPDFYPQWHKAMFGDRVAAEALL